MIQERLPKYRRENVRGNSDVKLPEAPQEELFGFKIGDPVLIKRWARPLVIDKIKLQTGFIRGISEDGEAVVHFTSWNDTEILLDSRYTIEVEKISKAIYSSTYDEMIESLRRKEAEFKEREELAKLKKFKATPTKPVQVDKKKKRWWRK